MKVKVKTVKQEAFDVEIDNTMKVADIKGAIETQCGVEKFPRDALQIVFKGKRWTDDDATVEDMGVADGAVIVVVVKPTKPAAPVAEPSAPAAAAAATTGAAPATDAPAEPAGAVAGADAFATGTELQASIKAISEMGFEEAEVKRAMRAAFNNPERAVEYLMSGIPEHLAPPAAAPAAGAAAAPAGGAPDAAAAAVAAAAAAADPAAAPAAAAGGPNAAPLDMWGAPAAAAAGGGAAAAAGGAAGAGGVADLLQQVRGNPAAAQRIQQLLQSDPNQLMALLQELSRQNPEFAQQLQANPQATLGALMGAGGGGGEGGMAPPGQMTVELTPEDDAAVGRLEALGFSRIACVQAFIACERSEELAANYLLENATDEDMQ